ncbi:hypothetical protein AAC387_Pa02g4914 [Persea americana]
MCCKTAQIALWPFLHTARFLMQFGLESKSLAVEGVLSLTGAYMSRTIVPVYTPLLEQADKSGFTCS